ncbi:MAG: hypothetical protein IKN53_01845, partial [Oscillibacter sp.]|nr:hypothetical protein [Oscillibacter sp.]
MKNKVLATLLTLCMLISLCPLAMAADPAGAAIEDAAEKYSFDNVYAGGYVEANAAGVAELSAAKPAGDGTFYAAVIPSDADSADMVEFVALTEDGGNLTGLYARDGYSEFTWKIVEYDAFNGGVAAIETDPTVVTFDQDSGTPTSVDFTATLTMSDELATLAATFKDDPDMGSLSFTAIVRCNSALIIENAGANITLNSDIFEIDTKHVKSSEHELIVPCVLKAGWKNADDLFAKLKSEMSFTGTIPVTVTSSNQLILAKSNAFCVNGFITIDNIPAKSGTAPAILGTGFVVAAKADTITLETEGSMTLRVVDANGNPVKGAAVTVTLVSDDEEPYENEGVTDEDGIVSFEAEDPLTAAPYGTYNVTVEKGGFSVTAGVEFSQDNANGNAPADVTIPTANGDATPADPAVQIVPQVGTPNILPANRLPQPVAPQGAGLENAVDADDVATVPPVADPGYVPGANPAAADVNSVLVELKMNVTKVADPTDAGEDESQAILGVNGAEYYTDPAAATASVALVDFVEVTIDKVTTWYVDDGNGPTDANTVGTKTEAVHETDDFVTTLIPLSADLLAALDGRNPSEYLTVYRNHNGTVSKMSKIGPETAKEGWFVVNQSGTLYIGIKSKNFSTFAIGVMANAANGGGGNG